VIEADGRTRYLGRDQFSVRVDDHWTSDSSGARYPSRWTIALPSESLQISVRPVMPAQENRSRLLRRLFYWEGAVVVERNGRRAGQGYVEMVGYGRGMRPAL
jgi:predicted secreted hydrolase